MGVRFLAIVIALFSAAVILLSAAGLYMILPTPHAGRGGIEVLVGQTRLVFAPALARFSAQRGGGQFERLDLAVSFPDFAAAGEITAPTPRLDLHERSERTLFMTLTPQDNAMDPADRPVKLYARFLEKEEWSHPGGLVMRRFLPGSPFETEDLYLSPPEGRMFAARCMRPPDKPDGLPDTCLHEFQINHLNVQLRFSPGLLADWEKMTEGARRLVEAMSR